MGGSLIFLCILTLLASFLLLWLKDAKRNLLLILGGCFCGFLCEELMDFLTNIFKLQG